MLSELCWLMVGFDDWRGSHTLDALRGRRIMIFRGWLTRGFARLWQPLAASGGPSGDPPDPLSIPFQIFDASMARLFDASMLAAGLSLVLVAG